MNQLFARKRSTHQTWTASGKRIPVTVLHTAGNVVMNNGEKNTLVGYGQKKDSRTPKAQRTWMQKIGLKHAVRSVKELSGVLTDKVIGDAIKPSEVFTVGDVVKVTGISKGMGFAGGMKRHGFRGGPKTHGQSDRWRAPGGSSSGTTLGRLFKNKRMAGRGGNKTVSVLNLQVMAINDESGEVLVKGVVPGALNGQVTITKTGTAPFEGLQVKAVPVQAEVVIEAVQAEEANAATDSVEAVDEKKAE